MGKQRKESARARKARAYAENRASVERQMKYISKSLPGWADY